MKILHSSDWHLGRSLYGQPRYDEFSQFLNWLLALIKKEKVDLLLVAGDIFDTTTPSHQAQKLYYQFLCEVTQTCCKHVVIIAGNHDSASLLNAPKQLLHELNIDVIGSITDQISDELICISSSAQTIQLILCAVPYLRDRDIRKVELSESLDQKQMKQREGIVAHYQEIAKLAQQKQQEIKKTQGQIVPIIAMGHLFAAGGHCEKDDGVRELYVGSLAHVNGTECFDPCFDYVALGHLHVPQIVASNQRICYSGSPIPMGFGEAKQSKSVVLLEFDFAQYANDKHLHIERYTVPRFQQLESIRGDYSFILERLNTLKESGLSVWLEIDYQGDSYIPDLREQIDLVCENSLLKILKLYDRQLNQQISAMGSQQNESLDELTPIELFTRCLNAHDHLSTEQRVELLDCYQQVVAGIIQPEFD